MLLFILNMCTAGFADDYALMIVWFLDLYRPRRTSQNLAKPKTRHKLRRPIVPQALRTTTR